MVYAPETSEVQVEKLALDLGGGTDLVLAGTLGGITPELIAAPADARPPGHLAGKLTAALNHVPVARLGERGPWRSAAAAGNGCLTTSMTASSTKPRCNSASTSIRWPIRPMC